MRRRDSVVALFWPELDDHHARSALRQALRFLRRELGDEAVVTRGDTEVGIEPGVVTVDANRFERLCEEGKSQEALALYRGDFLDGFFLSEGAAAFDHWVDSERARFKALAAKAAWALARTRRAAGDVPGALEMARYAAALSPHSEVEAARAIAFLDESGDRGGALAAYDELARRLRAEFETEPAPETRALVRDIRARSDIISAPARAHAESTAPNESTPSVPPAPRQLRQGRALLALGALAIVALSGYLAAFSRHGSPGTRAASATISGGISGNPRLAGMVNRAVDARAQELYVKARYWWSRRGRENLLKAASVFQQALDIDPTYAAAYSGLADSYAQLGYGGYLRPDDAFPKARAAAARAIELDTTIADPHATLGYVAMYYDWNWAEADSEYRVALALNPHYATAHEWYGLFLAAMGRYADAQAQERQALADDPLALGTAATAGWVLHYSGNQAEAERQLRIALRSDSTFAIAHLYLGRVLQFNGQLDSALAHFAAMGPLRAWVPAIAGEGNVYALQGDRGRAHHVLHQLDSLSRTQYVTAYAVALVHAALGNRDSTFVWLNKAVDERTHWLLWLNRDRRWDPVRSDPRFRAIVRRVRLPD